MSTSNNEYFSETDGRQGNQSDSTAFSAPLGTLKSGRLVFASGAERLKLAAGPSMPYLYQARFRRYAPRVWVQEGTVAIIYRRIPFPGQLVNLGRPLAEIRLNGSIPWEIEFHRGVSHLSADLAQLQFRSLDILGGADQIRLMLSKPSGTAFIYISGGISQGSIRVPSSTGIRVQVSGGSTNLIFVEQRFAAIGSETSLESPGYENTTSRYDICIAGGISNFTVERNERS